MEDVWKLCCVVSIKLTLAMLAHVLGFFVFFAAHSYAKGVESNFEPKRNEA